MSHIPLSHTFRKSFQVFLDLLFPPVCAGCEKKGVNWCADCQSQIGVLTEPLCLKCGSPAKKTVHQCPQCVDNAYSFVSLRSWVVFEGPTRSALHRLKYKRDWLLGDTFAFHLSDFVRQLDWQVEMVIPIPLGRKRRKKRGYNQVEVITAPLAVYLDLPHAPRALTRAKETRTQVGLSAAERRENVKSVFQAKPAFVKGRSILLMDDVATTGATLSSAADALLSAGASQVYALTVARALPHHDLRHV